MSLLRQTAELAEDYLAGLAKRPVRSLASYDDTVAALDEPLPSAGREPGAVIERLEEVVAPATVASAGPRYFGFVTGGHLPAALAADWLASAWDQNSFTRVSSPAAAAVEAVAERWVLEALRLPRDAAVGFVTGATAGNFAGVLAARHRLLERAGWDVEADGLIGAPAIRVVVGADAHSSLLLALRMAGLGSRAERVPTDEQGAMRADALRAALEGESAPTLICAQAGNVSSGAFDPLAEIAAIAREGSNSWVHVDGAFGLWAAASASLRHLVAGAELADSWSVDAHKWLNVPYDNAMAIVADARAAAGAMSTRAAYLAVSEARAPFDVVPEMSRRARALPIYAALASLGSDGLARLVERCCELARRFAAGIGRVEGAEVLNDVVLNQVVVRFRDDETTAAVIDAVRAGGEAWFGPTTWREHGAARVSVSNWRTTEDDIDRLVAACERAVAASG